jgi:hypothetical protein
MELRTESKVGQLNGPIYAEKHVVGLYVPVDYSVPKLLHLRWKMKKNCFKD